jgi:fructose-1,6-bisphosphatase I
VNSLGITLSRHILEDERIHPEMAGDLSVLLAQIAFAAKILSREIGRAALVGRLGLVGEKNVSGESQKKLDVFGNEVVVDAFAASGLVAAVVSEELEDIKQFAGARSARYILCIDPVDGSSNTDINGSLGTIFGFYRCRDGESIEHQVRRGSDQVLAGYVMYGTSTVLVYSGGHGVHGFTLDRDLGEFLYSHENIHCPAQGRYYSANVGRSLEWDPEIRKMLEYLTQADAATRRPYSLRYSGALVADFHRCLLEGGFYFYPADADHADGKLRLLYECAPLAFLIDQAGGRASTGSQPILAVEARSIHQRSPLVIGSRNDVALYEQFVHEGAARLEVVR